MSRLEQVQRRRAASVERAAAQRADIGALAAAGLRRPLGWADKAVAAGAFVKARPLVPAAAVMALLAARLWRGERAVPDREGAARWARRGLQLWRWARVAQNFAGLLRAGLGSPI